MHHKLHIWAHCLAIVNKQFATNKNDVTRIQLAVRESSMKLIPKAEGARWQ